MKLTKSKWVLAMMSALFTLFVSNPIIACGNGGMKNCHCSKKCHCASGKKCPCAKPAKAS